MKLVKDVNKSKPICNKGLKNNLEIQAQQKPYLSCKFCDFKSTHKSSLLRHQINHKKSISCSICEFKCSTKERLKNHMLAHTGEKYFECYYCDYINKQQCLIKKHIARKHPNVKLFKCNYCDFKAVDDHVIEKHTLKLHKQDSGANDLNKNDSDCIHEPEQRTRNNVKLDNKYPMVVLKRCDDKSNVNVTQSESHKLKTYKLISEILLKEYNFMIEASESSLNNNVAQDDKLIELEGGGTLYQKVVKLKGDFEIVASIYSGVQNGNNAEINKCDITFRKRNLLLNNNQEQLPPMLGTPCNKIDNNNEDRGGIVDELCVTEEELCAEESQKQGVKLKSKKLQLPCDSCDLKFTNKERLMRHKTLKHLDKDVFKCTLCNFTCLLHKNLLKHIRKQHGSKSSPCGKCTFSRKNTNALEKHLMSHNKKAVYNCDSCHYTSNCQSVFEVHKFIHSGETKHVCNVCHYKSATKYGLKRHIKTHSTQK